MAYIRTQKLTYNTDGTIRTGSASIYQNVYIKNKSYHSRPTVRERLGKVLWLADDKKSGIFQSPSRGLIGYDSGKDSFFSIDRNDPRIKHRTDLFPGAPVHTIFGDAYLLMKFLENTPLYRALCIVFPEKEPRERLLAHLFHSVLRDGGHISCDDLLLSSVAQYLFSDVPLNSLHSDTRYFTMLGDELAKEAFFRAFVQEMRTEHPEFGKGCYVDSTPLPNDIDVSPLNALSCHGLSGSEIQMRLVMVLDEETGLPVWYSIIPGNVLDINTITHEIDDVKITLDIDIDSLVLDAGYASKELIHAFHIGSGKTMIAKCPARRGFHFNTLYQEVKDLIYRGKYLFVRERHTYFGYRKKKEFFGEPMYAYIYVDRRKAELRLAEKLEKDPGFMEDMTDKEKDWQTVKRGFFILLSNMEMSPAALLDLYFRRTDIEGHFKTAKEYLKLLPLNKWSDTTVRGKILNDCISTILFSEIRKELNLEGYSPTLAFGKCRSLMCTIDGDKTVHIETPNKQVKNIYESMKIEIPATLNIDDLKKSLSFKW